MIAQRAVNHSLLISPYGGNLVDLLIPAEELDELRSYASRLPSLQISERSVCDLELLACGAFSPLDRFVGKEEHQRILDEMRLRSGHIFPIPVPLPVNPSPELHLDREFALRSVKNELLAILTVEEIYEWDKTEVAQKVFGIRSYANAFPEALDSVRRDHVEMVRALRAARRDDLIALTRRHLKPSPEAYIRAYERRFGNPFPGG